MPHRFIYGETLIFIGETLGYSTLLKKDDRVEFCEYLPSGHVYINKNHTW
jgi:hypothetical protein